MKNLTWYAIGVSLIFFPFNSFAGVQTETDTLDITVNVSTPCTLTITDPAAFNITGAGLLAGNLVSPTGTIINYNCSVPHTTCFGAGVNGISSNNYRQLSNGAGGLIEYMLQETTAALLGDSGCNSIDSSYTETFTYGSGWSNPAGTGSIVGYFALPQATSAPSSGTYTDSITVTTVF